MKTISSRQNPLFKRIREAIREHAGEIAIEGPKAVADAIAAGWNAVLVATRGVDDDTLIRLRHLLPHAGEGGRDAPLPRAGEGGRRPGEGAVAFTPELFDSLAETKTPQSVIALFERPRGNAAEILARRDTVAVALDGVQDPGNVGTIVRLAAAFDAAGVLLLPGSADPFSPKAIRSSAGAILTVAVAAISAKELIAARVPLLVADMHGDLTEPPARNAVLVFGNEGSGVSQEIRLDARAISIPMSKRVESLNVASSAAILLSRSYARR